MKIKEMRMSCGMTQKAMSAALGMPLRTFIRYENDEGYGDPLKRAAMLNRAKELFEITEEKGLLNIDTIKSICSAVFESHKEEISFCYLFGSYAKGYASESSDVDLILSTTLTGLRFVGLIEELRQALHKKVDLLRLSDQKDNVALLAEIMKDGVKIYG